MHTLPDSLFSEHPNLTVAKLCRKCCVMKPYADFPRDPSREDGYYPWCKACRARAYSKHAEASNERRKQKRLVNPDESKAKQKAYRDANLEKARRQAKDKCVKNKEKILEQAAAWRAKNKAKVKLANRKNYEKNKESRKLDRKAYYIANKKQCLLAAKRWSRANIDRVRKWQQQWREKNRDRLREYYKKNKGMFLASNLRRRTRQRSLPFDFTRSDMAFGFEFWGGACAICGTPFGLIEKCHWDHWVPLTNRDCPGTIPANMLPLCAGCNLGKSDSEGNGFLTRILGSKKACTKSKQISKFFSRTRPLANASFAPV